MMEDKVYIAGPFFNAAQIAIIKSIEDLCEANHIDYYSPRLHSGSDKLTPEQRKDRDAWQPVIESNIVELRRCTLMIAVIEYAMPRDSKLMIVTRTRDKDDNLNDEELEVKTVIELVDNGTSYEMGRMDELGKPVIGYRTQPPIRLNLMLSHTLTGIIYGPKALNKFLGGMEFVDGGRDIFNFNAMERFDPSATEVE